MVVKCVAMVYGEEGTLASFLLRKPDCRLQVVGRRGFGEFKQVFKLGKLPVTCLELAKEVTEEVTEEEGGTTHRPAARVPIRYIAICAENRTEFRGIW